MRDQLQYGKRIGGVFLRAFFSINLAQEGGGDNEAVAVEVEIQYSAEL